MHSVAKAVPHEHVGTELVREWVPEGEARAVVVLAHGIAEHSGRYERTGGLLSDAGFHVRSFDAIGHGTTGGDRVDIEDWSMFHDQLHAHMVWARSQGKPVVLMGHSMGSLLAMGYALEERSDLDLLVLTAPTVAGGAKWQRVLASLGSRLAPKLAIAQNVKGHQLSADPAVGEAYFADPLVHTKATMRFGRALFDEMDRVKENLGALDVPTLALHGGSDRLIPPQTSAFLADLPTVERRLFPTLRHEILNEPEGPEVVAEIVDWINQRI